MLGSIGIALSRLAGLLRERVLAQALGQGAEADALRAALRIPNLIQNLLGETALSGAFTPVYARLVASDDHATARALLRRCLAALSLVIAVLVLSGMTWAASLVALLVPGFDAERAALTTELVRLIFPATGLLVMSAVGLAVQQAHGQMLSSFAAPVVWNLSIIAAVTVDHLSGAGSGVSVALAAAWGALAGALLQVVVQFFQVTRLSRRTSLNQTVQDLDQASRQVWQALPPVLLSRGAVQLGSVVDTVIVSLLPLGSLAAYAYAQALYLLPLGLFGNAIAAALLTALARTQDNGRPAPAFLQELHNALRRAVFFFVPTVLAGSVLATGIVRLVYGGGAFDAAATRDVSWILMAAMPMLIPSLLARLLGNAAFSLGQASLSLHAGLLRLLISSTVALLMVLIARTVVTTTSPAMAGLVCLASTLGALAECVYLEHGLRRHGVAVDGPSLGVRTALLSAGLAAAASAWLWPQTTLTGSVMALITFGVLYLALQLASGQPDAHALLVKARVTFARKEHT